MIVRPWIEAESGSVAAALEQIRSSSAAVSAVSLVLVGGSARRLQAPVLPSGAAKDGSRVLTADPLFSLLNLCLRCGSHTLVAELVASRLTSRSGCSNEEGKCSWSTCCDY